ncbi:TolC family protein [Massilia sp. P8910]|uniref:TolC family protein n=1 Tax=Massilia antarctica TaxID=2765360 RepID=UPI001E3470F8|nr:TolC family protein [Massilia antarctica]MCE3607304.1 TolC family protein [Massilia antarctica]
MGSPIFPADAGRAGARRPALLYALAVLLATTAAVGTAAAADPLTLEQAQRLAVQRSRQLAGIDSLVTASREMALAAGQLPDPVLSAGIENVPVGGEDRFSLSNDGMTMRRFGIMQELTRAEKRRWRAQGFLRTADKDVAQKQAARADIERDTALAWLERYYAQEMAKVADEQLAQGRLDVMVAEGAYRGGRGSQAELLAARSALFMLEDRGSDAARRVRGATTGLARWIGNHADAALANPPSSAAIPLHAAQLETQLAHHPRIEILARREDMAEAEAGLAEANKKADWSVEFAFQQRRPRYANMVSVALSLPLQWDRPRRQDRESAAKLAMLAGARAEREETQRAQLAETRAMMDEWENGKARIGRYERELLPLAHARSTAVLSAYSGGKAALSDVLAARREETDVRLQMLGLRREVARLWAQLSFLIPRDAAAMNPAPVANEVSQ